MVREVKVSPLFTPYVFYLSEKLEKKPESSTLGHELGAM